MSDELQALLITLSAGAGAVGVLVFFGAIGG